MILCNNYISRYFAKGKQCSNKKQENCILKCNLYKQLTISHMVMEESCNSGSYFRCIFQL